MRKVQTISWAAALCLAGVGAFAVAQPKGGQGKACDHDCCPMHEAAALSDIKVESTAQGAVIQLVAKRPEDIAKVQQHAQAIAERLKSGECPMHAGHGGGHHHGHHAPPPKTK